MDAGELIVALDADANGHGFRQRWAGVELWSSRPLEPGAVAASLEASTRIEADDDWRTVFEPTETAPGVPRRVLRAATGARSYRVDFDDESYLVAAGGDSIVRTRRTSAPELASLTLERLLGAPFALALALRGTYLLHASAVGHGGRAIALTAPSGGGKSTLAAAALASGGRWRRLADDVLPVRLGASTFALPHFPQLKLGPAESYPLDAAPVVPLAALVELERGDAGAPLELERLGSAPATLALASATVAARLFDGELLAAHLVACAEASAAIAVARLRYPSGLDRLPTVLDRLTSLVP